MKLLIDLFPFGAFLLTLSLFGIYPATAVLMISLWLALALDYFVVSRKLNAMLLGTAVIASVFGGLTLTLRDPVFIHVKPTIIFGANALVFLGSHFIGKQVLLQRLMGEQLQMPDAVWRKMSFSWIIFLTACAAINWYVAFHFSEKVWGWTLGGLKLALVPFLLAHIPFISPYVKEQEAK